MAKGDPLRVSFPVISFPLNGFIRIMKCVNYPTGMPANFTFLALNRKYRAMAPDLPVVCPLCQDRVSKLLYRYHIDSERVVIERIKANNPEWTIEDGICSRCIDYYHTEVVMQQRLLPEVGPYFPIKSPDDFIILPTPLRLDADPRFCGRGITICFIDSGFYPHPDLMQPKSRIKIAVDIANGEKILFGESESIHLLGYHCDSVNAGTGTALSPPGSPGSECWHGMMTSVVCAGNGYSSKGLYRGIASEALLVLLKVQDSEGRIRTENIVKAMDWVVRHHEKLDIRVLNMSLGTNESISYRNSEVDQLAESLIERGVNVVAAVGNDEAGDIKPPANALNVIAVGGIDDNNSLNNGDSELYHSSYGETVDGLMKPELMAQAIWVAAPILPGTAEKEEAEWLNCILQSSDEDVKKNLAAIEKKLNLELGIFEGKDVTFVRQKLVSRIRETKFISSDYMHVDGTSFAAPIVSAVIAQLLEAEPALTPAQIRHVLFSTASRIPRLPVERQGFGIIRPRKAIIKILKKGVIMKPHSSPFINRRKKTIEFYIQNDCAQQISLSGSFNHWAQDVLLMEPGKDGMWKITIPMLPTGTYRYKFFIDDRMWVEDVDNPYREPDGVNGWNSVLILEN